MYAQSTNAVWSPWNASGERIGVASNGRTYVQTPTGTYALGQAPIQVPTQGQTMGLSFRVAHPAWQAPSSPPVQIKTSQIIAVRFTKDSGGRAVKKVTKQYSDGSQKTKKYYVMKTELVKDARGTPIQSIWYWGDRTTTKKSL
ncbi:MAG: hypothetical protein Barrevirus4_15 [Barrevirus sp.]|uniref:Uncharacterized protein n=1 Tax=Barrevirus sp. TaxID=2487763 RepID=A0A3G4ZSE7_9VIRU|nr:MAG: hypothetical protein Barrevirus4_15 [Barrevirus sp.]